MDVQHLSCKMSSSFSCDMCVDLGRAVHGLDATAAQTFGTLFNMLDGLGVEMVITHMENPEMEKLLRAHGVIGSNCCMCVPLPLELLDAFVRDLGSPHHLALSLCNGTHLYRFTQPEMEHRSAPAVSLSVIAACVSSPSRGGCSLFGKCRVIRLSTRAFAFSLRG